ncbi:MAG: hypothetical protein HWN68_15490 [Desulfobacterales bacterium]|nr:hypothetical protein [Desulfobacterales bacterium]
MRIIEFINAAETISVKRPFPLNYHFGVLAVNMRRLVELGYVNREDNVGEAVRKLLLEPRK